MSSDYSSEKQRAHDAGGTKPRGLPQVEQSTSKTTWRRTVERERCGKQVEGRGIMQGEKQETGKDGGSLWTPYVPRGAKKLGNR